MKLALSRLINESTLSKRHILLKHEVDDLTVPGQMNSLHASML